MEANGTQTIRDVSSEDTALHESITSSGFTPSQPKIVLTVSTTCGIRVIPPRRMTSDPPSDCETTMYYRPVAADIRTMPSTRATENNERADGRAEELEMFASRS